MKHSFFFDLDEDIAHKKTIFCWLIVLNFDMGQDNFLKSDWLDGEVVFTAHSFLKDVYQSESFERCVFLGMI